MMFWNILKNDIARGIFKRKYLYIISTVVIAALVIIADMSLGRKTGSHGYTGQVSVGDLFQVFYRGSRIIKPDNMAEFYISEQYLFMVLGIAFIVGNYCVRDFGSVGMQIIIRCGSIGKWFAGKVMWCFASALYMTALTDILIVIISVIHGYEPGLDVHMEVLRMYGYPENVTNVAAGKIVVMSLVLPLLSLFAIALVQMFLSMICSSVIALLLISTGMIITIFSGNVLLAFNGLMCMRNNIYTAGGTDSIHMMIADVVIILISIIAGYIYVSRMDILNAKEI